MPENPPAARADRLVMQCYLDPQSGHWDVGIVVPAFQVHADDMLEAKRIAEALAVAWPACRVALDAAVAAARLT